MRGPVAAVLILGSAASAAELPVRFEPNMGQAAPEVRYLARVGGRLVLFTEPAMVVIVQGQPEERVHRGPLHADLRAPLVTRLDLSGEVDRFELSDPLPGPSHYLTGADESKWIRGVPAFGKLSIRFRDGAAVVLAGGSDRVVAGIAAVARPFASEARDDATGVGHGWASGETPVDPACARSELAGTFQPAITFGTYYGGGGPGDADVHIGVAVGEDGAVFTCGRTLSADFPVIGGVQSQYGGQSDGFVVGFLPDLSGVAFSTFLGGAKWEQAYDITVDALGSALVTGNTMSCDFPVVNALQPACPGGGNGFDAFFARLTPAGDALVYSSYLGGSSDDSGAGIRVAPDGTVVLAGISYSSDFPLQSPLFPAGSGYVCKLDPSGTSLVYSTKIKGVLYGLDVDGAGRAVVGGETSADDYPLVNPYQATKFGGPGTTDGVVSMFAADGQSLVFSTYLGGGTTSASQPDDLVWGVDVDGGGRVHVGGQTHCTDFPLVRPAQAAFGGTLDAFVTVFEPPVYDTVSRSTYAGGIGYEWGGLVAADRWGNTFVCGVTDSPDYPQAMPLQAGYAGGMDAFLTRVDDATGAFGFSTCLGGPQQDAFSRIALDASSNVYGCGSAGTGFPIPNPLFPYNDGLLVRVFAPYEAPEGLAAAPGPDPAAPPRVRGYDVIGRPDAGMDFAPYGAAGYGAHVGTGAIDAPGARVLTGPGPGAAYGPHVRAFRADGTAVSKVSFYAYGTLRYGTSVTGAEVDGDAHDEIVTGAGPGAVFGPHVRGFQYDALSVRAMAGMSFHAYGTLKWGVNVGSGQLQGGPSRELLTMPGPGAAFGPQARGFGYAGTTTALAKVSFHAFGAPLAYGGRVEGGDVDEDGYSEILAGRGPGAALGCQVRGFDYDGAAVSAIGSLDLTPMPSSYGAEPRGCDLDGDPRDELHVASGPDPAYPGRVKGYEQGAVPAPFTALDLSPFGTYGLHAAPGDLAP